MSDGTGCRVYTDDIDCAGRVCWDRDHDLSGWEADVPARDTDKSVRDSFIVREGRLVSLGKPEGHLLTKQAYRNYRLEVEYRFPGIPPPPPTSFRW
jgi:hypothetical protein